MTFAGTVDAWLTQLQAYVSGLDTGTVPAARVHRYAAYSRELLHADQAERHLAVFPSGDAPESVTGFTTAPSDAAIEAYTVVVWEDASSDAARLIDDEVSNAAWLALFEAIRARFYVQANVAGAAAIAGAGTFTRYRGGSFDLVGTVRYMSFEFTVRIERVYT